jgi:hypothetical protein
MKLRTIALAIALACGVTGVAEAKHNKSTHFKPKYKQKKFKKHKFQYNVKSRS